MKYLILALLSSMMLMQMSCTQPGGGISKEQAIANQRAILLNSLENNDVNVATTALYNLIELVPEDTTYTDTLLGMYFSLGLYVQAEALGEKLYQNRKQDTSILEIRAVSLENTGRFKESLEMYEKLFPLTQELRHQYQLASLQYKLGRVQECTTNLGAILESPKADDLKISIQIQNRVQEVPLKAAAYNIMGVVARDLQQPEAAYQNFQKALELFPDFLLAQANLKQLTQGSTTN